MSQKPRREAEPGARSGAQPGLKTGAKAAGKPQGKPKQHAARPPSQRQLRVAEEIRHVLAGIFARTEFRDPELAGVLITVTEVRISPDLKKATAFVTRLGRSDVAEKLPALRRAAAFLRMQIAHAVKLRVAPDISFQPDTALDYAMHIEDLLHRPEVLRDLSAGEPNE